MTDEEIYVLAVDILDRYKYGTSPQWISSLLKKTGCPEVIKLVLAYSEKSGKQGLDLLPMTLYVMGNYHYRWQRHEYSLEQAADIISFCCGIDYEKLC